MLLLGVKRPVFSLIRASVGARVFSRLAWSREINLTVPSGACPGLFMLDEWMYLFFPPEVCPLLLLLVFFCIPVHIWLRPTTLTLCAPASVVWFHVVTSVYVEREWWEIVNTEVVNTGSPNLQLQLNIHSVVSKLEQVQWNFLDVDFM